MPGKQHDQGSSPPPALTEIPSGTPVFTSDHKHVGKVHDIVVDATDDSLTRIVVNAGPNFPAPGFGARSLSAFLPKKWKNCTTKK